MKNRVVAWFIDADRKEWHDRLALFQMIGWVLGLPLWIVGLILWVSALSNST